MQFTTLALAALAGLATAQTTVHVVTVSTKNNSLVYMPDNIKAAKGEMVQFQFVGGNHTVTQSTFDNPCMPINMMQSNVTGFHSGYLPVAASAASGMIPTYSIMINNTTPLWVYCAQGKHCQAGMTMVINENTAANASRSLANFKTLASKATANIAPGGSASSGTTGTGTASGTGTTGSGTSTGTTGGATGSNSTAGTGTTTTPATAAGTMVTASSSLGLAAIIAALFML